jgi:hypothetical protein
LLTTLELAATTAQLQGATFQYSAMPIAHPRGEPYDFRADMMKPLSRYAYECAQAGRLWTPFGRTDDGSGTSQSITETQNGTCPADDASIRYLAAFHDQFRLKPGPAIWQSSRASANAHSPP